MDRGKESRDAHSLKEIQHRFIIGDKLIFWTFLFMRYSCVFIDAYIALQPFFTPISYRRDVLWEIIFHAGIDREATTRIRSSQYVLIEIGSISYLFIYSLQFFFNWMKCGTNCISIYCDKIPSSHLQISARILMTSWGWASPSLSLV